MFHPNSLVAEMKNLHIFAMHLTQNKSDANDLVQATCLRALEKMDYFEEGSNLLGWTSKIMFNLFVSDYRRKTKFESKYDPETYIEKLNVSASQEVQMALADTHKGMMKIGSAHREVLILICIKNLSYQEASVYLSVPIGTIRSRLARARNQLRSAMGETPAAVTS